MDAIGKALRKQLVWGIVVSCMFVAGIPMIIFGATGGMWILMAAGIACTVIGFYGAPMVWVSYGNKAGAQAGGVCRGQGASAHRAGDFFPALQTGKGGARNAGRMFPERVPRRLRTAGGRNSPQRGPRPPRRRCTPPSARIAGQNTPIRAARRYARIVGP